jgi:hypothetical protein
MLGPHDTILDEATNTSWILVLFVELTSVMSVWGLNRLGSLPGK